MQENTCKIIAIAGGSGSGKTTLAKEIVKVFGTEKCSLISQDNYYHDLSEKFDYDGGAINFDHPDMLEFSLLSSHLKKLKQRKTVNIPCYDFSTHSRTKNTEQITPTELIIVDGILILNSQKLSELFDLKIYIEATDEIRFQRRLNRDVKERKRKPEGVLTQWNNQVLPMHKKFVENSASLADIILSGESNIDESVKKIVSKIKNI